MNRFFSILFCLIMTSAMLAQSVDDAFPRAKMRTDLAVFKELRMAANSGLYRYRTEGEIDSIYNWAAMAVEAANTYRDFYNIICQLTDFEGSLHNDTDLPDEKARLLRQEDDGYFPYPIIWVDNSWRINYAGGAIDLGAEVVAINDEPITTVLENLYKYYPTDGINTTGKRIGIKTHFAKYYRLHYGPAEQFIVTYRSPNQATRSTVTLSSVSYTDYYRAFHKRHSKYYDHKYFSEPDPADTYKYEALNDSTSLLTIFHFSIGGNANDAEHKTYVRFLDSIFQDMQDRSVQHLIVDVRLCGGGTDPNDVVTYSYLSRRPFQESRQVWSSFQKLPFLKYYDSPFPRFLRPLGVGKYNRQFKRRFPIERQGRYYMGEDQVELQVRYPASNNFKGKIYLLISPAVASAGSLFAAMVTGNDNSVTIGQETMGGYYGHNGHTPLQYVLPKSKIVLRFSMENIDQDVPVLPEQHYDRGIIPDYELSRSLEDFLNGSDTQLQFALDLILSREN